MTGNVWIGDDENSMKRVRPLAGKIDMPRSMRRAELACPDAGRTPMVLAVVYPRDVKLADLQVLAIARDVGGLGDDFEVACRCSRQAHRIDGGRLRSEVAATRETGRVPVIAVGLVEEMTGNDPVG